MGYLIKAILGAALFVGGIVLFNVKLLDVLDIGTCASGNTAYQITRPCPEGTGSTIMLMMAGIFGGLIGAGIFAFRGQPPWQPRHKNLMGFGTFAWGLFFTATGASTLIASLTDDSLTAGSDLGGKIVGIMFLVMGVPALLISLWGLGRKLLSGRDERPAAGAIGGMAAAPPSPQRASRSSGGGDSVAKLERLQKLRESGALTESEFASQKAKILSEM
ncbi:MAG: SHOCT domain-containing protein [Solirubrobacterales bacterium]|nr:SHOCT domain-containing protein [Solirubrobacterales bacterium]